MARNNSSNPKSQASNRPAANVASQKRQAHQQRRHYGQRRHAPGSVAGAPLRVKKRLRIARRVATGGGRGRSFHASTTPKYARRTFSSCIIARLGPCCTILPTSITYA